jgi:hypothetical protein
MQSNVPDHHTDELIKIIDDLTDIVLEKNKWATQALDYKIMKLLL